MKKSLCIILSIFMLFAFVSCKSDENGESSSVSEISETPGEDFRVNDLGNGVYSVFYYHAGDEIIKIPAEIDGKRITVFDTRTVKYNGKVKEIYLPETIERIIDGGLYSFDDDNTSALEKIHLPESVKTIERGAFRNFKNLNQINLPATLETVGDEIFAGCSSLNISDIPAAFFSEKGYRNFAGTGVTHVNVPEGVTVIPELMFFESSIKTISLPSTLKTISYGAFGKTNLSEITLPNGLEKIDERAFYDSKLVSATVPASVTEIYEDSFGGMYDFKKLVFEGDVPEKFSYQLDHFISVPASMFEIWVKKSASGVTFPRFCGFPVRYTDSDEQPLVEQELEYVENSDGSVTVVGYLGSEYILTVPETLGGKPVTAIGEYMLRANNDVIQLTLPEGVKTIGDFAFNSASLLKKVTLPQTLETIGENAFGSCIKLENPVLPESLKTVKRYAFAGCDALTDFVFPESVETIGEGVFDNCHELKTAKLPSGLKTISDALFFACYKLESVNVPETVEYIGHNAFGSCYEITELTMPSTLKTVGDNAFDSTKITSLYFHEGLESIGEEAFESCYQLAEVVLPASLKTVCGWTFNQCHGLKKVTLMGDAPEVIINKSPYGEDNYYDFPNNCEFTLYYYEGAQGLDSDFWSRFDQALVGSENSEDSKSDYESEE